jgi:hypothetical protein
MNDLPNGTAAPWDREDAASRSLLRLIAQSTNDGILGLGPRNRRGLLLAALARTHWISSG